MNKMSRSTPPTTMYPIERLKARLLGVGASLIQPKSTMPKSFSGGVGAKKMTPGEKEIESFKKRKGSDLGSSLKSERSEMAGSLNGTRRQNDPILA